MKVLGQSFLFGFVVVVFIIAEGIAAQGWAQQVTIEDVEVRLSEQGPVVLLYAERKVIPIYVDQTVAGSIHGALSGLKFRRPLSHDLMHSILEAFQGKVIKTELTLKDGIFSGALTVVVNGDEKIFDSRSSDSIALAIHFKAPILVSRELLDTAGKSIFEERHAPTKTL